MLDDREYNYQNKSVKVFFPFFFSLGVKLCPNQFDHFKDLNITLNFFARLFSDTYTDLHKLSVS